MHYDVDEQIKLAEVIFKEKKPALFTRLYPFTTENIAGYLSLFDLSGKTLFTVGSSCDQALNAILYGCKDITIFDICHFVYEYYYLKMAAIKTLSIEEFMKFFCYKNNPYPFFNNKSAFDIAMYAKISEVLKELNEEVLYFWNQIFDKYQGVVVRSELFSTDEYRAKMVKTMNPYLNSDDDYYALKNKIDKANVKIVNGNIFDDEINGTYDNVFLSNLSTYHSLKDMRKLFDKMLEHLNNQMLVAYLYSTDKDSDYMEGEPEIYNLPEVFKTFPKEAEFISFISARSFLFPNYVLKDSVITYKKVKKMH